MKLRDFIRAQMRKAPVMALKGDLEKHGLKDAVEKAGVKVVEEAPEGEQAVVIAMPKGTNTPFDDNAEGYCIECAREIIHRPHYPADTVFICLPCAMEAMGNTED